MARLLPILLFFSFSGVAQNSLTIDVDARHSMLDAQQKLLVCQVDLSAYQTVHQYDELRIDVGTAFTFDEVPTALSSLTSYMVSDAVGEAYQLFFTHLPIIKISTSTDIQDEPKVLGTFSYADTSGHVVESMLGIEFRGGSSQAYPKKTFDIEFWEDSQGDEKKDYSFGSMREDDDWILDALYNEPLRIRSYVSNNLWLDIHTPYYIQDEPKAKAGANNIFVEVFLNGAYQGVYTLMEEVDRKQLQLEKEDDAIINGMLYKGIAWGQPTFDDLRNYNSNDPEWEGFEIKFPKDTIFWAPLYDFAALIVESDDGTFNSSIVQEFELANGIDYFVFLNLLAAYDNVGKNIFIAKYKQNDPFFYVPWDLDGVLGTEWQGKRTNFWEGVLDNGLYRRLIQQDVTGFRKALNNRWLELRHTSLSTQQLLDRLMDAQNILLVNNIYAREALTWPDYTFDDSDTDYLKNWVENRLLYLDMYFDKLSEIEVTFPQHDFTFFPNPVRDVLQVESVKEHDYQIYNVYGHVVQEGRLGLGPNMISCSALASGMYLLRVGDHVERLIRY